MPSQQLAPQDGFNQACTSPYDLKIEPPAKLDKNVKMNLGSRLPALQMVMLCIKPSQACFCAHFVVGTQ
jgi:hypothetical protein